MRLRYTDIKVTYMFVSYNHSTQNKVWCRYNAVNFLTNIHKRHPIARPLGRDMGCLLWIQHLIDILPQSLQLFMQYLTTVECRYNAVQYNKILYASMQWRGHSIKRRFNLQTTHHTSPSRASYDVSFARILENIDRVITAPHCILDRVKTALVVLW